MRLVLIATSANQPYIFASNRLREAVGASELVRRSATQWVRDAVRASGPGHAEIIQESSGTTLLVLNGPGGRSDRSWRVVNELTRRILREAPGLDVAGTSVPIDGPVPTRDDIDAVFAAQRHGRPPRLRPRALPAAAVRGGVREHRPARGGLALGCLVGRRRWGEAG